MSVFMTSKPTVRRSTQSSGVLLGQAPTTPMLPSSSPVRRLTRQCGCGMWSRVRASTPSHDTMSLCTAWPSPQTESTSPVDPSTNVFIYGMYNRGHWYTAIEVQEASLKCVGTTEETKLGPVHQMDQCLCWTYGNDRSCCV